MQPSREYFLDPKNIIHLFPNPVEDVLSVVVTDDETDGTVSIIALNGQVVKSFVLNGKTAQIDVSDLDPAIYLLRVNDRNAVRFLKR